MPAFRELFSRLRSPSVVAALAAAALVTWLVCWSPFSAEEPPSEPAFLELRAASQADGSLGARIDEGHGVAANRASGLMTSFKAATEAGVIKLPLPPGRIRMLRLSFFSTPSVTIDSARVKTQSGTVLGEFSGPKAHLLPGTKGELKGNQLALGLESGRYLSLELTPEAPLTVPSGNEPWAIQILGTFLATGALFLFLQHLLAKRPRPKLDRLMYGIRRTPALTLGVVSLAAAIASSYPVVFCDRSFVAPANGAPLLYFGGPTLPGAPAEVSEDSKGADVAAMMWQNLPYGAVEHRALFRDGELPLWNRYNSAGVPLVGQGLSMLGDPLHLLPLLTGSVAWAWDIKFLAAKFLFAFGMALCAWSTTRKLGLSAAIGASAAWIGFFAFRFNHPAIFGVCYAPWVLLPWLSIRAAKSAGGIWGWAAALMAANCAELASGTAKEAFLLLLCLNATGFLALALERKFRRLTVLGGAALLSALLTAPLWLLFLDAMSQAATIYDQPTAYQLQPGLFVALFDDLFSQDFTKLEYHTHPSLNFFYFAGILWLLANWKRHLSNRTAVGLAIGTLLPLAMVFGIVPPAWIMATPVLGKIQHIHNVFGCVLIVLLPVLAAIGLSDCMEAQDGERWQVLWRRMAIISGVILLVYLGFIQAIPQDLGLGFSIEAPLHSRFFLACAPALVAAMLLVPQALRWLGEPGARRIAGIVTAAVCFVVLHFRHGMYTETKFDAYVMNPKRGMDLVAQSPAVDRVLRRQAEPGRAYGLSYTLSPGYSALLGLESICGPDALMNRPYREFCQAAQLPLDLDWRIRLDEANLPQLQRALDVLNLRFYFREGGATPPPGLTPVGRADLQIFQSPTVWPRAFFTDNLRAYGETGDFLKLVAEGDGQPFAACQGEPPVKSGSEFPGRQIVPAREYRLTNNTTTFTIEAPGAGVAVLSENFEAGNFQVTSNGMPVPYFRVNHMFKGIALPKAGTYRIEFRYVPRLLRLSLWLSATGLLIAIATPIVLRRRVLG